MSRVANISVDVDGLDLYYKIHGLTPSEDAPSIYETGVVSFLDLFKKMGVKATFFVINPSEFIRWAATGPPGVATGLVPAVPLEAHTMVDTCS